MSYMHINNLYKDKRILEFKKVYAMEKIHGTSSMIRYKNKRLRNWSLAFFAGGSSHEQFVSLFNQEELRSKIELLGHDEVIIYGEAYGGKIQGMKNTYGKDLKFVAFEVKIKDSWLSVPDAHQVVQDLGLDFVSYKMIDTDISSIELALNEPSVQAIKNGCGDGKKREGIVLRPPFEVILNNGERLIAKHKHEDFRETTKTRPLDQDKLEIIDNANKIAIEWVTEQRLTHVLDNIKNASIENMKDIIIAMTEDIEREAKDEIVVSRESRSAIGRRTATMFKNRMKKSLEE